ncbi:MAG: ATP synthase subunit I [Polyangiales bacterium]
MTKPPPDRLPLFVAAFGAAMSLAALGFGGQVAGWSTAVGSALALVNVLVLRTVVLRVVSGDIHKKLPLLLLIVFKMGAFMVLVYWLITKHWVEPVAFTVGLSSLVVGLLTGSLIHSARQRSES